MAALFHLLLLLFLCSCNCNADSATPTGEFCDNNLKINSSEVSANVDSLLAELVSSVPPDGFGIASYGKAVDQVYGLGQCRGVTSKDCFSCIQDAAQEIRKRCTNQADARIWYDYCFLRYSTKKFFGKLDTSFGIIYYNVNNVTNPGTFNKQLGTLVDKIKAEAIMPANKALGRGTIKVSPFVTLYALVQCTRDLPLMSCSQCLATAIAYFHTVCNNKEGCQVLYTSCYVRYEIYPFFFPHDPQKTVKFQRKNDLSVALKSHNTQSFPHARRRYMKRICNGL